MPLHPFSVRVLFLFSFLFLESQSKSLVYRVDINVVFNVSNPNLNSIDNKVDQSGDIKSDVPLAGFLLDDKSFKGIPVYDLNLNLIKTIPSSSVYITCYLPKCLDNENKTLSVYERDMLTLYASFINSCGTTNIDEDFGLGLIRSHDTENIMGMYSEGYNAILPGKAFHVRLTIGNLFSHVYDHPRLLARIVAFLELACHERSHYDKPNWNHVYAHSNEFQTNYNTIYHRAIRNLHSFESLYHHVHGNYYNNVADVLWIFLLIIFLILTWSFFLW